MIDSSPHGSLNHNVSIVVSKLSDTSPRTNRWPLWKFVQSSNCWFSNFGQYVQRDKSSFIVPHIIVNHYYSRIYCIERSFTHSLTHVHAAWYFLYVCIFYVQWGDNLCQYVFIIFCTSDDIIDLITWPVSEYSLPQKRHLSATHPQEHFLCNPVHGTLKEQ